jgi:phage terminase small subunit
MTRKEMLFCYYYTIHYNASKAAEEAGYSKNTSRQMAYNMRQKSHIRSYIKQLEEDKLAELGISKHCYMVEYNNIAKMNVKDYVEYIGDQLTITENDEPVIRLKMPHELTDSQASVIKKMKIDKGRLVEYEFHDKSKALSDMLKIMSDIPDVEEEKPLTRDDLDVMEKLKDGLETLLNQPVGDNNGVDTV